jgi:hypothetical protein
MKRMEDDWRRRGGSDKGSHIRVVADCIKNILLLDAI